MLDHHVNGRAGGDALRRARSLRILGPDRVCLLFEKFWKRPIRRQPHGARSVSGGRSEEHAGRSTRKRVGFLSNWLHRAKPSVGQASPSVRLCGRRLLSQLRPAPGPVFRPDCETLRNPARLLRVRPPFSAAQPASAGCRNTLVGLSTYSDTLATNPKNRATLRSLSNSYKLQGDIYNAQADEVTGRGRSIVQGRDPLRALADNVSRDRRSRIPHTARSM